MKIRLAALISLVIVTIPAPLSSAADAPGSSATDAEAFVPSGDLAHFELFGAPRPIPELNFQHRAGADLTLGDFEGQIVLLNFWASWCQPCVREMPDLDRLEAMRGGDDFKVVAVSLDIAGWKVVDRSFAKWELHNLDKYLMTVGAQSMVFELGQLPITLLLDRNGQRLGQMIGPAEWDSDDALELIDWAISR